ncbi:hypothetical protein [Bosea sp. BK604]|uniref:hypothetical protein n=1 Tax=Bosea sp. BK604 TaxID=2512180 RepID=UPI00105125D1|nr:hypothetical protein [Bosea sp. BK604]TCR63415.1 hypothetical protein EV560_10862 [Bosea sp. BK604]
MLNSIKIYLLPAMMILTLGGCNSVTVDANYASTNQGIVNSGLSSLSTLYLWDTSTNSLVLLDDLAWPQNFTRPDGQGTEFKASRIKAAGISFTGGAPLAEDIVKIEAKISDSAELVVKDYRITRMRSPALNFIQLINASTPEQKAVMQLPEAAKPRSPLRYVIVNWAATGKEAELRFEQSASASGKFPIRLASGEAQVEFKNLSTQSFKNDNLEQGVPAIIQLKVFQVGIEQRSDGSFFTVNDQSDNWNEQLLRALRAR